MGMLAQLGDPYVWQEYLIDRYDRGFLTGRELLELEEFVRSEGYRTAAKAIGDGIPLPPPRRRLINRMGSGKKRVVYTFEPDVMMCLKLLSFLLYRYDGLQSAGCYSFRRGSGAQAAIRALTSTPGIGSMWCCKLDVRDYFNSIDTGLLLPVLREVLADDEGLYAFFEGMLTLDLCESFGQLVSEKRGVMAGTPTSPFLANLYLRELDRLFTGRGIPYARYSDDIVVFAPSREILEGYRLEILGVLSKLHLSVNGKKERVTAPHEPWEFLGFSFRDGEIDLSRAAIDKLKGKIRRKARALRRWMLRRDAGTERAVRAMIGEFNRRFYDTDGAHELTWSRWYFPVVTTDAGLHEIDLYLQQHLRYLSTGKFGKKNYAVRYADLRRMGYRSLVHAWYAYRQGGDILPAPADEAAALSV